MARVQHQREGGQCTELSDRISLSPIGVGRGPDLPEMFTQLWDTVPDFSSLEFPDVTFSSEPVVASPAGQGTNIFDYDKREDVVKAVSTVAFLPRGKNREALIKQFNITREEVGAACDTYNAALVHQGNPPVSVFPTIIWQRVTREPVPSRRRPGARQTTATITRPTVTTTAAGGPSTTTRTSTSTSTRTTAAVPSTCQQGMHDRLDQLTQQVHQDAQGRRICNITHPNSDHCLRRTARGAKSHGSANVHPHGGWSSHTS